jgi:hypothetical protein
VESIHARGPKRAFPREAGKRQTILLVAVFQTGTAATPTLEMQETLIFQTQLASTNFTERVFDAPAPIE